ncbi:MULTISPECIES: ferredoxin reductase family protein [Frankia]|nr:MULTISPECIES: ferredoxin reductase family protein [Frankia]
MTWMPPPAPEPHARLGLKPRRPRVTAWSRDLLSEDRLPDLAVRLGLTAVGVAVIALWWVDTPSSRVQTAAATMTALGRVAGLLAAYLVLVELMLMARVPALERAIGFDRLASWHRGLGTNIVLLIGGHVLLTVWGYGLSAHEQPLSELVTVITRYPDEWEATIGALLFVAVGISSAWSLRARISYEAWYAVHLTVYAAVALTFFHQIASGEDFVDHPRNRLLWTALYLAVAACLVVWRIVLPARADLRHRMTVDRVVVEAAGVVSVWIRGRRLDQLGALPGQFLLWRFLARGQWASAHAYSLSMPPHPDLLRITVKDLGDQSRDLARLRPGTRVLAEGPFGHFTHAHAHAPARKALLIGGGSGIGPVRAVAEDLVNRGWDVIVLQRASRPDDLPLGGELSLLAAHGRLVFHQVVGSRRELGYDPLASDIIAVSVPDVAQRDVFVCGPPGMTAVVARGLRDLGVPTGQIHTEEYSLR